MGALANSREVKEVTRHSPLKTSPEVIAALNSLCKANGGLLHPRDVVAAARSEGSPLHWWFDWDDDSAAEKWRMEQARQLIQRIYVQIQTPEGKKGSTQVFVSLSTDRHNPKGRGGYRHLETVLTDDDLRNQLIHDAMSDMQHFEDRYKTMRELATVVTTMRKARKELARKTVTVK